MKIMKKAAALVLALCLMVPVYSVVSQAASGTVSFTDPQTKTGESVEVACALRTEGDSLQSFDITLKYDAAYLAFESGDEGVTKESDGVLKYSGTGDGTSKIRFTMKFQALQTGTTKIEVTEATGTTAGGETVDCTNGSSAVEIAQGTEPVTAPAASSANDVQVTVGDTAYTLTDNFKTSDIPVGFAETTISYEGADRKFVKQENGSMVLGYLTNSSGEGDFFLYNEDNATFSAFVQATVSPSTSIVLLQAEDGLKVPSGYQEVKLTVNEHEFPAWQDTAHEGFYLVYAMNTGSGEKSFYQYDRTEESYQRYVAKEAQSTDSGDTRIGKLTGLIEDNLFIIIAGVGILILIFLIIIIVLAMKLRHRNLELDDLYNDFGDSGDDEDDLDMLEDRKAEKRSKFRKQPAKDDFDDFEDDDDFRTLNLDDDYDFDDDSEFNDDDYADEYYEDEDGGEEDFDDDIFEDDYDSDFDDDYDADFEDEYFDDDDDMEEEPVSRKAPKRKKARKSSKSEQYYDDEDFDMDFIDLD